MKSIKTNKQSEYFSAKSDYPDNRSSNNHYGTAIANPEIKIADIIIEEKSRPGSSSYDSNELKSSPEDLKSKKKKKRAESGKTNACCNCCIF